jgi:Zn-dependent protease
MAMFGTSWRVGRIAGIEVRIDSSWAVIALLITYSMYLRASTLYPELTGAGAVGVGVLATVLFFGSVLVHELAHALVSEARGSGSRTSPCSCSAGPPGPGWSPAARATSS